MNFIEHMMQQSAESEFKSVRHARQALDQFLRQPRLDVQVGDYLERNNWGKEKYKMPSENQAMIVIEKFDGPRLGTDGDLDDYMVAVAIRENTFRQFTIDSRYYKLAEEKSKLLRFVK